MMFLLIPSFFIQGTLIYSDKTGRQKGPISPKAFSGMKIWRNKNCQACHQIYGFGGFLGPDLTNSAGRFTVETLGIMLSLGPKQMPSFNLTPNEIENLLAFLQEMDTSGISQPRVSHTSEFLRNPKLDISQIPWFVYKK